MSPVRFLVTPQAEEQDCRLVRNPALRSTRTIKPKAVATPHIHTPHHWQLRAARVLSGIFRPVYFPVVGVALVFQFTILSLFPLWMQLMVLLLVIMGTLVLPRLTIRVWRKMVGLDLHLLRLRRHRFVPYVVHIVFYAITLHYLYRMHLPPYVSGIIISALLIQAACTLINVWWKISSHSAGAGGVIGALVAYSLMFYFNPIWWLCLSILVSGLVDSSRMLLRQHSLSQVLVGTLVGIICGCAGLLLA